MPDQTTNMPPASFESQLTQDPIAMLEKFKSAPPILWMEPETRGMLQGMIGAIGSSIKIRQALDEVSGQARINQLRIELGLPQGTKVTDQSWQSAIMTKNRNVLDQIAINEFNIPGGFPTKGEWTFSTHPVTGEVNESEARTFLSKQGYGGQVTTITTGPSGSYVRREFPGEEDYTGQIEELQRQIDATSDEGLAERLQHKQDIIRYKMTVADQSDKIASARALAEGMTTIARGLAEGTLSKEDATTAILSLKEVFKGTGTDEVDPDDPMGLSGFVPKKGSTPTPVPPNPGQPSLPSSIYPPLISPQIP